MKFKIPDHWDQIEECFDSCISNSKHCAIATVDNEGVPHITPIGFIFLVSPSKVIYFEKYSKSIPQNYDFNKNVCLMVVNTGFWFWLKSLFRGKFASAPGVRLYGKLGELRKASSSEMTLYKNKIESAKHLKGKKLIWDGFEDVREISLTSFSPISYPRMMEHLWRNNANQEG